MPSVLLTKEYSKSLKEWLKEESAFGQYVLCFDGKRDNWNATTFHKRCDNKPHTVTILRTIYKKTFGAYSDIPWSRKYFLFGCHVVSLLLCGDYEFSCVNNIWNELFYSCMYQQGRGLGKFPLSIYGDRGLLVTSV